MESGVAQVGEAQRRVTLRLKNTGLATAIDLGESNDIHPLNKKDLAHRCVLQMNRLAFNKTDQVAEGPMVEKAKLKGNGQEEPTSIRYAWENNPPSSIYNTDGLPASSFQIPISKN